MTTSISFSEYSKMWYKENTAGVCYTYAKSLEGILKHLNQSLGSKEISEINSLDITEIITTLARKNPNTGKPTAKRTLQLLVKTAYRIFDSAIDNDLIIKNPAKGKLKAIPKYVPQKEVKAISKAEQKLIMETPHRCQLSALLMMLMGLRRGELIALEWSDFNFENNTAYICKHAVKIDTNEFQVYPGTKNGKCRYVNIPNNLAEYLKREEKNARSKLVTCKVDGLLHTPSSFEAAWKGYINTLNYASYKKENSNISKFDPKGYTKFIDIKPHQLRHTYATLLYLSHTDILTASKLMGHSGVELTLNIYTHLDEEYKTLDISNFNDYLANDL